MQNTITTAPGEHNCHGARFLGAPAAVAARECPVCTPDSQDTATLRRTSAYTLRVACDQATADETLDRLAAAVATAEVRGTVSDTHRASQGGTPYVSVSFRIQTSDSDAIHVASHMLVQAGLAGAEAYLHTGLGVHRRILDGLG